MEQKQGGSRTRALDPELWVDRYGDYLYRYALTRIHDRAVAEDLVQETFLAGLNAREGFEGRSTEKTWLTGILKYKIIDHIRKKQRENPTEFVETTMDATKDPFDERGGWKIGPAKWRVNPTELLEQKEFWKIFQRCLSELSSRLRTVFALRELDGLSSEEIRELMGISATNCYVMLYRARMRIRGCLEFNWFGTGEGREA